MKQKHEMKRENVENNFFFSAKKWNFHFLLNRQPTDPEVESEFERQFDIGSVDGESNDVKNLIWNFNIKRNAQNGARISSENLRLNEKEVSI